LTRSNQVDNSLYQLLMYLNAHHELTTINMCSGSKQDDTGKYSLEEIIEEIAKVMDFEVSALIPIYDAYNAVTLSEECSASKLRDAIRSRLTQDRLFALVADVTLDENVPVWIDSD